MKAEIIYSLKPIYANLILQKKKNHEFRTVRPKNLPDRIWFYISAPESRLMYMAQVGEIIKHPEKILISGEGNQEFNNSENIKEFAYPIIHFYRIKEPLNIKDLQEQFGFTAPQSFAYINKYPNLTRYILEETGLEKIY